MKMRTCLTVLAITAFLALPSTQAVAADLFKAGQTTITVDACTITVDNSFKYVNYVYTPTPETLAITVQYSGAGCTPQFVELASRLPNTFTPKRVNGTVGSIDGSVPGTVTFTIQFTALKTAGKAKQFGMWHGRLTLDVGGEDVYVGVHVSASTASHP